MTTELQMLLWSVVLGLVQIVLVATCLIAQRGLGWTASARDEPRPPLGGVGGRLQRANANFMETFPFFAAVVLAAQVLQRHDPHTVLGAQLYFWARLAYVPVYAAGIPYLRTLVFTASVAGIVLVLAALF